MARFGRYDSVSELRTEGLNTIYIGRSAAEPGQDFAIKVFRPSVEIMGERQAERQVRLFLDKAAVQKKVASAGAQFWAPVYDLGSTSQGAFYVTDKYDRSAQQYVDGQAKLTPKALYNIVTSVVGGLIELKRTCGRPHGNLKPSNVLLRELRGRSQPQVALCDPAPPDSGTSWTGDLRAVAGLIYQLVTHYPVPTADHWQIDKTEHWQYLGKQADGWIDLCNRLISATLRPAEITLEDLAEELPSLKPPSIAAARRPLIIAAALAAVIIPAIFLIVYRCELLLWYYDWGYKDWLVPLKQWTAENRLATSEWRDDLKTFLDDLAAVPDEKNWKVLKEKKEFRPIWAALAKCRTVKSFLKKWPALTDVQNAAKECRKYTWDENHSLADKLLEWVDGVEHYKDDPNSIGTNIENIWKLTCKVGGKNALESILSAEDTCETHKDKERIIALRSSIPGALDPDELKMLISNAIDAVTGDAANWWKNQRQRHFDDPVIDSIWILYLYAHHVKAELGVQKKIEAFYDLSEENVTRVDKGLSLNPKPNVLLLTDRDDNEQTWRTALKGIDARVLRNTLGVPKINDKDWAGIHKACQELHASDPNRNFANWYKPPTLSENLKDQLCKWQVPKDANIPKEIADWRKILNELAADVNAVEDALNNWYTYGDQPNGIYVKYDDDTKVAAIVTELTQGIAAAEKNNIRTEVNKVAKRVQTLRKIEDSNDRNNLVSIPTDPKQRAEAVYAAYLRLEEVPPPWPKDKVEQSDQNRIDARLMLDAKTIPDLARQKQLVEKLETLRAKCDKVFAVQNDLASLESLVKACLKVTTKWDKKNDIEPYEVFSEFHKRLENTLSSAKHYPLGAERDRLSARELLDILSKKEDVSEVLRKVAADANTVNKLDNLFNDPNWQGTEYNKDKIKTDMKHPKEPVDANTVIKWIGKINKEYLNGPSPPKPPEPVVPVRPTLPSGFEQMGEEIIQGWPKYIRSTKDRTVVLTFIPGGDGVEDFYISLHEITNRQYYKFLTDPESGARYTGGAAHAYVDRDGKQLTIALKEQKDYPALKGGSMPSEMECPVAYIMAHGAKAYAAHLKARIPLIDQFWRAAKFNQGIKHLRSTAWKKRMDDYLDKKKKDEIGLPVLPLGAVRAPKVENEDLTHIISDTKIGVWPTPIEADELSGLIGNVWEWCIGNTGAVLCGGSCLSPLGTDLEPDPKVAGLGADKTDCDVGFRVVVNIPAGQSNPAR